MDTNITSLPGDMNLPKDEQDNSKNCSPHRPVELLSIKSVSQMSTETDETKCWKAGMVCGETDQSASMPG